MCSNSLSIITWNLVHKKLWVSLHTLEKKLHSDTVPKTSTSDRLCIVCHEAEDEIPFLIKCTRYNSLRNVLFGKIYQIISYFINLNDTGEYASLMTSYNEQVIVCMGTFSQHKYLDTSKCSCHEIPFWRAGISFIYTDVDGHICICVYMYMCLYIYFMSVYVYEYVYFIWEYACKYTMNMLTFIRPVY